jgi:hypothetical protein
VIANGVSRLAIAPMQKLTGIPVEAKHSRVCRTGKSRSKQRHSQYGSNGSKLVHLSLPLFVHFGCVVEVDEPVK